MWPVNTARNIRKLIKQLLHWQSDKFLTEQNILVQKSLPFMPYVKSTIFSIILKMTDGEIGEEIWVGI
jgi:hypothetical protein